MPISFPPDLALAQFLAPATRHIRRVEIYESDGVTRWAKDTKVRLKAGNVSVDQGRDERRSLDLTLSNDDGVLQNAPGEFWYDKIIKVYRGVKVNEPLRTPAILILSDKTAGDSMGTAMRSLLTANGFGNAQINVLVDDYTFDIEPFDIIVGLGNATAGQIDLMRLAYRAGKSVFVQDADAVAWIIDTYPTATAAGSTNNSAVAPKAGSTHPVANGWSSFFSPALTLLELDGVPTSYAFTPYADSNLKGLYLPGTAGRYASTPVSAELDLFDDDQDLRWLGALDDYTSSDQCVILGDCIGGYQYVLRVNANGALGYFMISAAGAALSGSSTAIPPLLDGRRYGLRITRRRSDGQVRFYYSVDPLDLDSAVWTEVGTPVVVGAGLNSRPLQTGLYLGSYAGGATQNAKGMTEQVQIRNGINGTLVFNLDFTDKSKWTLGDAAGATGIAATGQTVTVNGASSKILSVLDVYRDIDVRAVIIPDNVNPSGHMTIVIKEYVDAAAGFYLAPGGGLQVNINGGYHQSPAIGAVLGVPIQVGFTRVAATGLVTLRWGPPGGAWAGSSSAVIGAGNPTTISVGDLRVGSRSVDGLPFDGKIVSMEWRDGIDGPVVASFNPDFSNAEVGDTELVDEQGHVWTLNGNAKIIAPADLGAGTSTTIYTNLGTEATQVSPYASNTAYNRVTAFADPIHGGRAVAFSFVVNPDQFTLEDFRILTLNAFRWLNTVQPLIEWETQIGEFMIDRISEPNFPFEVSITGRDYTKKCIMSKFTHATQFLTGMALESVIGAIASNCGVTKRLLPATGVAIGRNFYFERNTSRWEAMKELATAYNYEIFFDAQGYLVLREYNDPSTTPPVVYIHTGQDGQMASYEKSTTDSRIFNHIMVISETTDADLPLIHSEIINEDPDSPTNVLTIGDRYKEVSNAFIETQAQADDLAASLFAVNSLEEFELSFSTLILPWLEAGDILGWIDPRPAEGDPSTFLLSSFAIPLDLGPMSGSAKRVTIV